MQEWFGKSLAGSWSGQAFQWAPGARRKFLAGTILYGIGILLQSAQNHVHSIRSRDLAAAWMLLALAVQIWGLVAHYHNSGRPKDGLGTADGKH